MTEKTPAPRSAGGDVLAFVRRFWLPIVLVILAIVFISTNTNRTDFTVFWVTINAPLWLMLTITVLVGFVVGWFVGRRRT